MKHVTQAEYDELIAARDELRRLSEWLDDRTPEGILHVAECAAKKARRAGFVVTIEQVPQKPLAMGNYVDRVSVRPARDLAASIARGAA